MLTATSPRVAATTDTTDCELVASYRKPLWDDTHDPDEVQHSCLRHQTAKVGPIQDIINRHVHGIIRNLMEFQGTLNYDNSIDHDRELILYSVSWSSRTPRSYGDRFNDDIVPYRKRKIEKMNELRARACIGRTHFYPYLDLHVYRAMTDILCQIPRHDRTSSRDRQGGRCYSPLTR